MMRIVGISGSLRRGSLNAMLLRAAQERMPDDALLTIGSIRDIPLYDGDLESGAGIPEAVTNLKNLIVGADGLLLVSPEYNNSLPGVFKNAIDWLTRPTTDIPRVFGDRPVAVTGASPGNFGTLLSQTAWLPVLRTLHARPWYGANLYVTQAHKAFDADGTLIDQTVDKRLRDFLRGFVTFVAQQPRVPRNS